MCGNKAEDGGASPTVWLAACHPHIFSEPHWRNVHTWCADDRWALSWTHCLSYLILTSQEGLFSLVRSAAGNFPKDTHLLFLRNAEVIGALCVSTCGFTFKPRNALFTKISWIQAQMNGFPHLGKLSNRSCQEPASVAHSDCSPAWPGHAPARQKQNG